jgi:hypothetical protein
LKLHREQVEALQPVDNAFRQLDPSSRIELGLQAPGSALSGWLVTTLDQGEARSRRPCTEPKMRSHDRCGHVWDRWFQEFLTKMQTEQLLELGRAYRQPDSN